MTMDAHTKNLAAAYGHLWLAVTPDQRVNSALEMIGERLTESQRQAGIDLAQRAGGVITVRELAVVDVDVDPIPHVRASSVPRALRTVDGRRARRGIHLGLTGR